MVWRVVGFRVLCGVDWWFGWILLVLWCFAVAVVVCLWLLDLCCCNMSLSGCMWCGWLLGFFGCDRGLGLFEGGVG